MTPEEHQLISGLFERMRALGSIDKDRDAQSLIMQSVLATPDAAYKLVQSVLVQESALEEAANRMQAMEQRIQQLETGQQQAAPASSGFLGGLFGSKTAQPAPRPTAVPMAGTRQPAYPQQAAAPWGNQGQQAPGYQQAGAYQQQQQPPQRAGGGFMKTAMATAAGVAGGMLVANAIGNMMGGSQAQARNPDQADGGATPFQAAGDGGAQGGDEQFQQQTGAQDPGNYDDNTAGQDEGGGGWFGGGGSDDTEF